MRRTPRPPRARTIRVPARPSGGGVEPDIRYLAADLQPGQDIARPWTFDDVPLLMLFDKTGSYEPGGADPNPTDWQGRNAVLDSGDLHAQEERPSFPEDRFFNAVCLTLGSNTQSTDAPPRPGYEPDTGAARDFPADGGAASLVTHYAEERLQGATMLFVPLPERDLLRAYVQGERLLHNFDWAKLPKAMWLPFEDEIFGPIDDFIESILANAAVRERLAGIKLFDEPDLMRRLPEGHPEIVGLVAGRIEAGEDVAFRVVATERPFAWEWEFRQGGSTITPTGGAGTYQPIVTFPSAGAALVRVRVSNWHATTPWIEFQITVYASMAIATPQITGLYSKTTDGIIRGRAIPNPAVTAGLSWSPGGGPFENPDGSGIVGQDGRWGVCTVNGTLATLAQLENVDPTLFPEAEWSISGTTLSTIGRMETGLTSFPAYTLTTGEPQTVTGCRISIVGRPGFGHATRLSFELVIGSDRLDAPRGWIRPEFLQVLGEQIHELLAAESPAPAHQVRLFVNFNGAVIEERFSPNIDRSSPGQRERGKLRVLTDVDQLQGRDNRGSRNSRDFEGGNADPTFAPESDGTHPPPPAAIFRLRRDINPSRQQLYSIDQYPVIGTDTQLRAKVGEAFPELASSNLEAKIDRIRKEVDTRDPVRAIHAFGRFLNDVAAPKRASSGEPQTPILRRDLFSLFWCQMWGFPFRRDGSNSLTIAGTPTTLPRDPESPAPNDGWDLAKLDAHEARFQAWMPIFLGAEGAAWFSQHFIADALIYLVFNPIAGEIRRYEDLRGHGRLVSKRGAPGFINIGPLAGRAFLGWENISAPKTEADLIAAGLGLDSQGNLRQLLPVLNEMGLPSNPPLPVGPLEMGMSCGLLQRIHVADPTPPTVEQYLFLGNPSWRPRTVRLDLTTLASQASSSEVFQEYRLGTAVGGSSFPITGQVDLTLMPREIRIYEREVSA